jgi:hypothetical protein
MNPTESLEMFSQIGVALRKEGLHERVKSLNTVVLANLDESKQVGITDDTLVTEDMILEVLIKLEEELKRYEYGDPMLSWINRDIAAINTLVNCRTALRKLGEVFE